MAVTMNQPVVGERGVTFSWESDDPTPAFWVYLNGELVLEETAATEYTVDLAAGEQAILEVFDTEIHTASVVPGSRLELCWYELPGVEEYLIEAWDGDSWEVEAYVPEQDLWWYRYRTATLTDGEVHRFRVSGVIGGEYAGTALEVAALVARVPDEPVVGFGYNGAPGRTVTIQ